MLVRDCILVKFSKKVEFFRNLNFCLNVFQKSLSFVLGFRQKGLIGFWSSQLIFDFVKIFSYFPGKFFRIVGRSVLKTGAAMSFICISFGLVLANSKKSIVNCNCQMRRRQVSHRKILQRRVQHELSSRRVSVG